MLWLIFDIYTSLLNYSGHMAGHCLAYYGAGGGGQLQLGTLDGIDYDDVYYNKSVFKPITISVRPQLSVTRCVACHAF